MRICTYRKENRGIEVTHFEQTELEAVNKGSLKASDGEPLGHV